MFDQPSDFEAESNALYGLLKDKSDAELAQPTQFKGWSIDHVIGHLHIWNHAADLSLKGGADVDAFIAAATEEAHKTSLRNFENIWLDGLHGRALLETWHAYYPQVANRFSATDPKVRLKWSGPDMSARSSITARLMETWAHGQEVYDTLGVVRHDKDYIKNIAVLGVNTFGWTYQNRGKPVPDQMPYVRLTAPSGGIWEWGDAEQSNSITGAATEFCQVVTQTRNIADTTLGVRGDVAAEWMAIAQCFAGPVEQPPAPGTRRTAQV
ncbi:TIGR03084 family metal-binding protein [Rhodobacteraceae bacterium D3-12]|nr:TIGR03084 family metal-binding protein [Rhodobacteraceae bacterium D3-12]